MTGSYVAVDLETTGLDPKWDKIIEIGAVRVTEGAITDRYETFVNPHRQLSEQVIALTGIQDNQLENAPGIKEVIKDFLEFTGNLPILGHNVMFDYSFLKRAAVGEGHSFEPCGIDTLKLARSFMPERERKNLKAVCTYFGVEQDLSHRALSDCIAAHNIYQKMENRYEMENPEAFLPLKLVYKIKKEQPASKRQKEHLQDLLKYHKISLTVEIEYLSKNELSKLMDKIIAQYGRIVER